MCKLQNLFEKSLYKVLHIRKKRLLLQPVSYTHLTLPTIA